MGEGTGRVRGRSGGGGGKRGKAEPGVRRNTGKHRSVRSNIRILSRQCLVTFARTVTRSALKAQLFRLAGRWWLQKCSFRMLDNYCH